MSLLEPFILFKGYMASGMPFVLCRTRKELTYRMYTLNANGEMNPWREIEPDELTQEERDELVPIFRFRDHRTSRHLAYYTMFYYVTSDL